MTGVPKPFNRERAVFLTKARYAHVRELKWTLTYHHIWKLTQKELKTKLRTKRLNFLGRKNKLMAFDLAMNT